MITQIEIDGFKTFKDFKVELAPFQVLVGPNGSGKSNLFDALYLLSRLAEHDILTAFQDLRGSADDQFTKYPDGKRANKMRFAVEMLVDHKVRDRLGIESILTDRRFRYEVEISTYDENGLEGLLVTHEALRFISAIHDNWSRKYGFPSHTETSKYLIETEPVLLWIDNMAEPPRTEIRLVEENDSITRTFFAELMDATVLSSIVTAGEFPQVFAVGQELRALKILHLTWKHCTIQVRSKLLVLLCVMVVTCQPCLLVCKQKINSH